MGPQKFCDDQLYTHIDRRLPRIAGNDLKRDELYDAWGWSFLVEALLNAHRRTGRQDCFDLAEKAIDHAFNNRDCDRGVTSDSRDRPSRGWGLPRDGKWINVLTRPARIVAPTLEYMEICRAGGRPVPAGLLDKCIAAVDEFRDDFFVSRDGEEGLYRRPARGDWEPLNHIASMGRALLRLHRLTGEERYGRMAHQIATFFKRSLVVEDGDRYAWAYRPNLNDRRAGFPTLFWKGDIDVSFAVDCVRAGVVFDREDLACFARTFKRSVIRPDFINCRVSVEKARALRKRAAKIGNRIFGLTGWMVLAEFDDEIEGLIEQTMADHADLMRGGWLGNARAMFGYSLKR